MFWESDGVWRRRVQVLYGGVGRFECLGAVRHARWIAPGVSRSVIDSDRQSAPALRTEHARWSRDTTGSSTSPPTVRLRSSTFFAPHRERTLPRMASQPTVLCVHDGTSLSFPRRGRTQGLGTIGSNQTGALARGRHLHATLADNPDGVPLGCAAGRIRRATVPRPRDHRPQGARGEEVVSLGREPARLCQTAHHLPDTRVVCTMDREADFLDLFVEQREQAPNVELLVRAKVNRVLGKDTTPEGDQVVRRLFDEVRNTPARGACTVEVSRQSARVKASKQPCKKARPARLAETTLRYEPVALPCPGTAPVALWMVHAREERPSAKTDPLEWFLLTTVPVTNADDAKRILRCYALRWRIEDYFRIFKSGCKVEELQHHSAERLERAIAIKMVVGWRIQLMVRLGREVPELPAEVLFSDIELRVLTTFSRSAQLRSTAAPGRSGRAARSPRRVAWPHTRPARRPAPLARLYPTRGHDLHLRAARRIRMTSPSRQVQHRDVGHGQG